MPLFAHQKHIATKLEPSYTNQHYKIKYSLQLPIKLYHLFYKGGNVVLKRILITGMSGTGKSTVIHKLATRGYKAVDADCDEFSEWVEFIGATDSYGSPVEAGRDWVWREDHVQELLSIEDTDILFVGGCAENMRKFLPQFDQVILLSAPADIIVERLSTRTNNPYGKHPDEIARVLGLVKNLEPLLRRIAGHEIDTSASLDDVVTTLLQLVW